MAKQITTTDRTGRPLVGLIKDGHKTTNNLLKLIVGTDVRGTKIVRVLVWVVEGGFRWEGYRVYIYRGPWPGSGHPWGTSREFWLKEICKQVVDRSSPTFFDKKDKFWVYVKLIVYSWSNTYYNMWPYEESSVLSCKFYIYCRYLYET